MHTPLDRPTNRLPVADYNVTYYSSHEPGLRLYTDVYLPPHPAPVLLLFHNWHGGRNTARAYAEMLGQEFVVVNVSMRGRDGCEGTPDANGWELLDAIDAVRHVKEAYAPRISNLDITFCLGTGAGGGNVYAAMAKFPGFFSAGVVLCGVSDYALWYKGDMTGVFKDEMLKWIGADPYDNYDAYRARSGLHLMQNICAPLLVIHGEEDNVIPVSMARLYQRCATELGKQLEYHEVPYAGHQLKLSRYLPLIQDFLGRNLQPPILPHIGIWRIGGYLETPAERLELPSLESVIDVRYELDQQWLVANLTALDGEAGPNLLITKLKTGSGI